MNVSALPPPRQYRSTVDPWLAVILAIIPVFSIVTFVASLLDGGTAIGAALFSLLVIGVLYSCLLFPLYYRLEDATLMVRYGLIRQHIPYYEITAVRPSRNPLSAPALSLRRLKISYGKRYILISPVQRDDFLMELAMRAGMRRDGDALTKA